MPSSEALRHITEALTLARRFALVIVVGPDDHPNLAQRVLVESLHDAGLDVRAPIPLYEGLDLAALVAGADAAPRALILTEPAQLHTSERQAHDLSDRQPAWPRALVAMTIDPFADPHKAEHLAANELVQPWTR